MSSNNVIYGFQVKTVEDKDGLVIDSNDRASEIIGKIEKEYKEKLLAEERTRRLQEMEESGATIPEGVDPDEFLGLVDTITGAEEVEEEDNAVDEEVAAILENAKAEADEIIRQAQEEAQQIVENARVEGEALKNLAAQDGKKDGYNEGTQQAAMELKRAQDKMDAEVEQIRNNYAEASLTLEHDIVEMCIPVFEKVFGTDLSGDKAVIFHLLDQCIMNIERTGQMQIKVSEGNLDFIKSKKDAIVARIGTETNIDFIADPVLGESDCVIETDGGIFDCSIDTELEALIKKIRALS